MAQHDSTVIGIMDGFEGLVEGRCREVTPLDVLGITNVGGTILGTSSKGDHNTQTLRYRDECNRRAEDN